jgi:DNA-binding GntR family transcriptional regulator
MNEATQAVYEYMRQHSDEDGIVSTSSRSVAAFLEMGDRAVRRAFRRLEREGRVHYLYSSDVPRYAVTDLVS